jgi:putative membrane protein
MTALLLVPTGSVGVAIVWGFMGIAFWVLLIALIVVIVRGTRTTARDPESPAVRLLEERYARGEISSNEFLERRTVLDRTSPDASS